MEPAESPLRPPVALGGGQRKLAGKVGQRLQRRAGVLLNLSCGLGGQPSALLNQRQRCVGLELAGAQGGTGLLQPRPELDEHVCGRHGFREYSGIVQRTESWAKTARTSVAV